MNDQVLSGPSGNLGESSSPGDSLPGTREAISCEHCGRQTPERHNPAGTNLFDAEQATAMVRYIVEGLPIPVCPSTGEAG